MNEVAIAALDALNRMGRICTPLRNSQRELLKGMLAALSPDMLVQHINNVGERDLINMFEAACRDWGEASAVAANIRRKYSPGQPHWGKYDHSLDALLPSPKPGQPEGRRISPPVMTPPVGGAPDMSRYALKSDLGEYMKATRFMDIESRIKRDNDQLRTNLTETLVKVTDALPSEVRRLAEEAFKALKPVTLHIVIAGKPPVAAGLVHRDTPKLIKMLAAGVNVYLHGPAGSGKTTAGQKCADAFGLPFYFAAKVESEYMLLGFKDARGETVRTQFREAYENGGVFLFDEMDGSSPSAIVALNAALANGICPFPDGVVTKHENFKCIGAGNTKLTGATREYVGRNQLDAASVDRFAFLEWLYDEALEGALATNSLWCKYVQSARSAVKERALKHLVTPRATYDGCKLLEGGLTWEETESAVLWKGLDADTVSALKEAMDVKAPAQPEL